MNLLNKIASKYNEVKKTFGDNGTRSFITWMTGNRDVVDRRELINEYKNLTWACISVIAEDCGKYKPLAYRSDKKEVEISHPFLELLKSPNAKMTRFDLFEAWQSYLELTGDFFLYVAKGERTGEPKELLILRPDKVEIIIDEDNGEVLGYKYKPTTTKEVPFEVDEIIHDKTFNPFNQYRGLGTVQAGLLYLNTENATSSFQYNFIKNQATPSGIVSFKNKIGKEAFDKFKRQWQEQNSGEENAGKTAFIRMADIEFTKMGLSLSDLNLGELKDITDIKVREMFRVPKALLGETDSSGLGRANIEAVEYIFSKRNIEPKLNRFDDIIRQSIKRFYNEDVYIDHISQVPADKEFKLREDQALVDIVKTREEIRLDRGLDSKPESDKLFVGFNQVPIEQSSPEIGEEPSQKIYKHTKDCNHTAVKKKSLNNAELGFANQMENFEQKNLRKYQRQMRGYLKDQEKKVLEMLEAGMGETRKFIDGIADEVKDSGSVQVLLEKLVELLFGAYKESGSMAIEFLGLPDAEFVTQQSARDAIFESTERLMKSFDEQTALLIQKQIAGGLTEGEDVNQVSKRIEAIYKDARGFRAERIAQTETHKAINEGTAESYKQQGIKKMQWFAFPTACEFCKAMAGKEVEIGESFAAKGSTIEGTDGGEFIADYTDVQYADLHPYCNCKLIPVK